MLYTLDIFGRQKTYSEEQLVSILEQYELAQEKKVKRRKAASIVTPYDVDWFNVYPQKIDRSLFQYSRTDPAQEKTRMLILEAFERVDSNPNLKR